MKLERLSLKETLWIAFGLTVMAVVSWLYPEHASYIVYCSIALAVLVFIIFSYCLNRYERRSNKNAKTVPSAHELVYAQDAIGLRNKESGETSWLPWCLFQNVAVVMREPFVKGNYVYAVMAEFHDMDVRWEVAGFDGFLGAMRDNLDGFDIELATNAINQLSREFPSATIYVSSNY